MITQEQLNIISDFVIKNIKQKYILVEKTFNLDDYKTEEYKKKMVTFNTFIENVVNIACGYFKIDKNELMSQKKVRSGYNKVTWCIAHLCKELPETPIPQAIFGALFGKHHSTVVHWNRMAEGTMSRSFEYNHDVNEVKKLVEQSLKTY